MLTTIERRGVYFDESLGELSVSNPFFDFRDEFNAARLVGGVTESIKERLYANFFTAVGEDVLRRGSFELETFAGKNEQLVLTTRDHRDYGDITQISLNGAKKRRAEGKLFERELAEVMGMRELRRKLLDCSNGSKFILIYPPGPEEEGYVGTSLTYIYSVKGESGVGRQVHVTFYKNALSLEGHAEFFKIAQRNKIAEEVELSPEFFVSYPVDISDNPTMQSVDDVVFAIDQIAVSDENFINPGVSVGSTLTREAFSLYEPQISESADFLTEVLGETIDDFVSGLTQAGLDNLELAYSFARRAVGKFAERGKVVSTSELKEDYRKRICFEEVKESGFDSYERRERFYGEVLGFMNHLWERYGSTGREVVGGSGCRGGEITEIGISLGEFTIDGIVVPTYGAVVFGEISDLTSLINKREKRYSFDKWTYCVGHNSEKDSKIGKSWCGPCNLCKSCDQKLKLYSY